MLQATDAFVGLLALAGMPWRVHTCTCSHIRVHAHSQVREPGARVEHEASTSKIGEDQLFYFQQRGIDAEKAVGAIISGFCREVS